MDKNKGLKMKTQTRYNKQTYLTSTNDIFSVISERVKADNNGCTVIVPHVCNNVDAFGAGFAGQVASNFPTVKADYHMLGKTFLKNNLGYTQFLKVYEQPKYRHRLIFANMIAQNGIVSPQNPRPLNYLALAKCMVGISKFIAEQTDFLNKNENVEIHAPKFGSGLAGGNWNFIGNLIEDIWTPYKVYIYTQK
jgi:hypothetical protein